jgi:BMFP domain-containing protein YqiC
MGERFGRRIAHHGRARPGIAPNSIILRRGSRLPPGATREHAPTCVLCSLHLCGLPEPFVSTDKQNPLIDLQNRVVDMLRASPAGDIERNVKALLTQGFQKLDLVTREEFDVQVALMDKLRAQVAELERTLAELESRAQTGGGN